MSASRKWWLAALAVAVLLGAGVHTWLSYDSGHYLHDDTASFAAEFSAPPSRGSAAERTELDELLALQSARTPAEVDAARADRKTDLSRFYGVLGVQDASARLPKLAAISEGVEDDLRPLVRAAKDRYLRLRPYAIEPRLRPCIANVAADLSYPSGHAAYGYSMAYLLADMVPERRAQLLARADEFARQRMVCGVHFRSDLEAGRRAAELFMTRLRAVPEFRRDEAEAAAELRAVLRLPALANS